MLQSIQRSISSSEQKPLHHAARGCAASDFPAYLLLFHQAGQIPGGPDDRERSAAGVHQAARRISFETPAFGPWRLVRTKESTTCPHPQLTVFFVRNSPQNNIKLPLTPQR